MDLEYLQSLMGGEEPEQPLGYQDIWVVGEVQDGQLTALTEAILGRARELANALGVYVKGILFGPGQEVPAQHMIYLGADTVVLFDDPRLTDFALEPYVHALASHIDEGRPEIVLFGATPLADELAPQLAARFGAALFTHCVDLGLDETQRTLLATVPRFGGEYYEILACPLVRPQFATVQDGVLPQPFANELRFGEIVTARLEDLPVPSLISQEAAKRDVAPSTLQKAQSIVCAGRGLQDEEGFQLAQELARALKGEIAGTRGAHDEGWIAADRIIGMGGLTVRPRLLIACGVAGAIQHILGVERADFVVAINSDPTAEIFQYADVCIVGDAKETVRALLTALKTA